MESDADDHHHTPITVSSPLHHIPIARIVSRDDCWSEGATSVLIDAWGERYLEMSRGNLKQSHWNEVAEIVRNRGGRGGGGGGRVCKAPKTDVQCKNRIDTVKKKYKAEKAKVDAGGPPSRWPFFERMERLIGPAGKKGANSVERKESAGQLVPVGVPVGVRAVPVDYYYPKQQQIEAMQPPVSKGFSGSKWPQPQPLRKRLPVETDSEYDDDDDSANSLPTETYMRRKRPAWEFNHCNVARADGFGGGRRNVGGVGAARNEKDMAKEKEEKVGWGESVRELTKAILKFGETYEAAENAKLQQMVEMEKERMKFTKELEVQRMKLLIKTQLELSQLARKNGRVQEKNNHHHGSNNNNCGNNNGVSSD
ncbi:hypothetical protein Drorol1_Dr00013403 [Drosera rotundifolia]